MLEVVRIFGELLRQGWKPLRTIEFASWDGGAYNAIGSTEYVEDNLDSLRQNGVAYLNVEVGVVGDIFRAKTSPLFKRPLLRVLDMVADPVRNVTFRHLLGQNGSRLSGLGAGGDYAAFQHLAGCTSIDLGFDGPGYPRHSCYETFEWMEKFGDPGFLFHKALAQIWALLILEIADERLLPFDMATYASTVVGHVHDLQAYAKSRTDASAGREAGFDVKSLESAANAFVKSAVVFMDWENFWFSQVYGSGNLETNLLASRRMSRNSMMSDFETDLLDIPENNPEHGQHGVRI